MVTHIVTFFRRDNTFAVLKLNQAVADVSAHAMHQLGVQIHGSHLERVHVTAV